MTNRSNEQPQHIEERHDVEQLARTLSQQSMQQWERAIVGLVAFPAALVTGAAATTLYAVSFVTRGFEVFMQTASNEGREAQRMWQRDEQRGNRHGDEPRRGNEQGERQQGGELGPERPRA